MDSREFDRLRRLGYRPRIRRTMLEQLVDDSGLRVRPLNRGNPPYGHHVADCPACARADSLWIAPDWRTFSTSCGCVRGDGGPLALFALLLRGVV